MTDGAAEVVAVVIPCFNVERHVEAVIRGLPSWVRHVVCVDDASPDRSAAVIEALADPRVKLVRLPKNLGVGGAMKAGYAEAFRLGATVAVKMDGDGQMDPAHLPALLEPVRAGEADYAKGNRFAEPDALVAMPKARLLGNVGLSFLTKAASGYWNVFDPTNGYTALSRAAYGRLRLARVSDGYFFESDLLVELNIAGAVVADVDMPARYGDEVSSLRISRVLFSFPWRLLRGCTRRFVWRYLVADFGLVTLCVLSGLPLFAFGLGFGLWRWWLSYATGVPATAGTVILAALPVILGFQLLLTALQLDVLSARALKRGRGGAAPR